MTSTPALLDLNHLPWPANLPTHFVFDVDGTLANSQSVITAQTNEALRKAYEANMPIIIATGRPLEWCDFILKDAGIKGWLVCSNGALVWDGYKNQIADVQLLSPQIAQEVIHTSRELGISFFLETTDEVFVSANASYIPYVSHFALEKATGLTDFPRLDEENVPWDQVTKISFAAPPEQINEISETVLSRFPSAVRGGPEFIDITLPHVTKLTGINLVHQHLSIDSHTGLGAGDSGNDVPWLAAMGISIAAPGATPDLQAEADYILPDTENPIADLINAILSRR